MKRVWLGCALLALAFGALGSACKTEVVGTNHDGGLDASSSLVITTPSLATATTGKDYQQALTINGATGVVRWTLVHIEPGLEWLGIDAATGRLTSSTLPTVTLPDPGASLTVRAEDGLNQRAEHDYTLTVICTDGESTACYVKNGTAETGTCQEGSTACVNRVAQPGCSIGKGSDDLGNCGGECKACPGGLANNCEGICKCGVGAACSISGEQCCGDAPGGGCINTQNSDAHHCGDCKADCLKDNSLKQHLAEDGCAAGACTFKCGAGFLNCSNGAPNPTLGSDADGCEADIVNGTNHCGSCSPCATGSTFSSTCSGGACSYSCNTGFGDCNSNIPSDGCETNLRTLDVCGTQCAGRSSCHPPNVMAPSCATGVCTIPAGSCAAGYGDCDGGVANGCETRLNTNDNCGGCGIGCGIHSQCLDGLCQPCAKTCCTGIDCPKPPCVWEC